MTSAIPLSNNRLKQVKLAIDVIKSGGLIAYPSESVYALGCDPTNEKALEKLILLKQRNKHKGFILVASSLDQIEALIIPLSSQQIKQILTLSSRPITWLIPAKTETSMLLCGLHEQQQKTIAIRFSQHPIIKSLCQLLQHPLISTSANISGRRMCYSADEVKMTFAQQLDYIVDAPLGDEKKTSQIRDLVSGKVLRD